MEVPFLDLQAQHAPLAAELGEATADIIASSRFILGPYVESFESAFADYVEAEHCVAVGSGTAALHLALIAAGVQPGDEVIVPAMTFVATAWAVSYLGATPVLVDVHPATYTMDPELVAEAITPRTQAIVPVHLYGQPADLGPLADLAAEHGIHLIEDAAQAHGASYVGRKVGALGTIGCFSFYPGKNLGAIGEGGAVVTNDATIADRIRSLRNHGQSRRYHHDELGFNYRMDAIQGAALGIKLPHLDTWIKGRRDAASRYGELLDDLDIVLPAEAPDRESVWHLYVVLHEERDRLLEGLASAGIGAGLHYPIPVHLLDAYRHLGHERGSFPVSERIADQCLSLPMFPELTVDQQRYVAQTLGELLG